MDHVINKGKVLLVDYYMEALSEDGSRVEDVKMADDQLRRSTQK